MEISKMKAFFMVAAALFLTLLINLVVFGGLGWLINWGAEKGINFFYVGISIEITNSSMIIYYYKSKGYF